MDLMIAEDGSSLRTTSGVFLESIAFDEGY